MARYGIVIDSARCMACYNCFMACKDEHWGNEWLPFAKPQPDTGHFWCKVEQTDHGQVPKVRVEYKPVFCHQCDDCPLIEAAPDCVWRTDDGFVIIDPVKAEGRKDLVDLCPYGRVYWNEELALPQKCTGCAHLVADGELPHCVDVCATGALRFGDEEEFAEEIAAAETLIDKAHGPHVYYINMPHLFIGGEVWDPAADEIIEGAKITLSGAAQMETESDEFGDFWFRRIDAGDYTVTIEAEGFVGTSVDVHLDKSLNIGDFPLERTADNPYVEEDIAFEISGAAPEGTPEVEVKEYHDVTAAMSVMSQADGGTFDDSGIASGNAEIAGVGTAGE